MEIEGKVFAILPPVSGTTARGNWIRQEIVVEFKSGDFDRKLSLSFWGDKTQQLASLQVGELVRANFDLDSREYNGRWFTTAQAWKLERGIGVAPTPPMDPFDAPPVEESNFATSYNEPF
ncbi:MAG: DUF3127 domain-containing protein [Rikenellaceae bacterium]